MAMVVSNSIQMKSDVFNFPFVSRKIVYSPNCDIFEEGDKLCKLNQKQLLGEEDAELVPPSQLSPFVCGESNCKFILTSLKAYEIHYACFHRYVCLECKSVFPSQVTLDMHIQDFHNSHLANIRNLQSSVSDCPIGLCDQKFDSIEERNEHLIKDHRYPPNFKFIKFHANRTNSAEKMDTSEPFDRKAKSKSKVVSGKYIPRVPQNICFGRGSSKTFNSKKVNQHTGSTKQKGSGQIENRERSKSPEISMMDLQDAL